MSEEQIENEKAANETGGFRFAVTLLVALGTILYAVYNYLQNTPVDVIVYVIVCGLTTVALILIFSLLFYILFKGYSMEMRDSNQIESLAAKWASHIYSMVFVVFTILLGVVMFVFVSVFVFVSAYPEGNFMVVIISTVVFGVVIGIVLNLTIFKKNQLGKCILIIVFLLAVLFLWPTLFSTVLYSPLQGHVTVNMESIYYKNDAPIPVLIHITGLNTGLSICLFQEESRHNLIEINNITLKPEHDTDMTVHGENSTLVGNTLNYGTYNVFINTTDLRAGYYELRCVRPKYDKTYGARGFYLLNRSQQSGIEEVNAS